MKIDEIVAEMIEVKFDRAILCLKLQNKLNQIGIKSTLSMDGEAVEVQCGKMIISISTIMHSHIDGREYDILLMELNRKSIPTFWDDCSHLFEAISINVAVEFVKQYSSNRHVLSFDELVALE
jgi:hypothetical protein